MSHGGRRVKAHMVRQQSSHQFPIPKVRIWAGANGTWSPMLGALADTGATYTIIDAGVLLGFLGFTEEQIRSGRLVSLQGLGNKKTVAYAVKVDLRVGSPNEGGPLELSQVDCLAHFLQPGETMLHGVQILLGQCGFFPRVTFWQASHLNPPHTVIVHQEG
jgi:hypothetical protein